MPFTARIGRAHSYRARSASKKAGLAAATMFFHPLLPSRVACLILDCARPTRVF